MATIFGTARDDSFTAPINGGIFTIDGLGGVDTLNLGTSSRSSYTITRTDDGIVYVDTLSGASSELHVALINFELLKFDSNRDTLDLRVAFRDTTPPTVTISDDTADTATGNVSYALDFSEPVTGLDAGGFNIVNGSLLSISGSGVSYKVLVAPSAGVEGLLGLTLVAGAVRDAAGNANSAFSAAAQSIDTKPPALVGSSPAHQSGGVEPDANLVLNFSEAVQRGSGSLLIKDASGAVLSSIDAARAPNLVLSGSSLTLDPSADLPLGSDLRLEVPAGALRDLAGNTLAAPLLLSFKTTGTRAVGTPGSDVFTAVPGREQIDGLAGIDSVVLPQARGNYTLAPSGSGYTVTAKDASGSYELTQVERLSFSNLRLAIDLNGNAGTTAKILGAVFGPTSITAHPDYVGVGLQLLDSGMSYEALIQLALDFRLGANASFGQVVDLLYGNVVGVAPPPEQRAFYIDLLQNKTYTTASLAVLAADTDLNQAHINLVGLAQTGLEYSL